MRLVCPACGAVASAEAWENDAAARQALDVVVRLPGLIQSRVLPYLGLFRQGDRGLAWGKALRLLQQLRDMVEAGTVRWEGGEVRPCPPAVWAAALDAVLARRPKGLKNHNYLRHVAWEMASGEAARAEKEVERRVAGRAWSEDGAGRVGAGPGPSASITDDAPVRRVGGGSQPAQTMADERVGAGSEPAQTMATEEERAATQAMLREFMQRFGRGHR